MTFCKFPCGPGQNELLFPGYAPQVCEYPSTSSSGFILGSCLHTPFSLQAVNSLGADADYFLCISSAWDTGFGTLQTLDYVACIKLDSRFSILYICWAVQKKISLSSHGRTNPCHGMGLSLVTCLSVSPWAVTAEDKLQAALQSSASRCSPGKLLCSTSLHCLHDIVEQCLWLQPLPDLITRSCH